MIYRKKYLDKFYLRYVNNSQHLLKKKLILSFGKSCKVHYKLRLSFFIQKFYTNKNNQFYNSQNKPNCYLTYSTKVPSSQLLLSRFYLVKHSNNLYLSGFQK